MNAKRQKLKEQFDKEAPQQLKNEGSGYRIFQGIKIHVNGYTSKTKSDLNSLSQHCRLGYSVNTFPAWL